MNISQILLIGQFFPPINGCSLANEILAKKLDIKSIECDKINTSVEGFNDKGLGKFSLKKVTPIVKQYANIFKIRKAKLVYTTPGQTFFGVLKFAPFFLASRFYKVPYIIHVHGNFLGKQFQLLTGWKKKIFQNLISHASHGIVLSESLRPIFYGLLDERKVSVIGNFAEDFLYNENLEKPTGCLKILYLSNLIAYKGVFEIIKAVEILKEKGIAFELHLAGGMDINIADELNTKIDAIPEIKYHGIISGESKKALLESCNIFCLPTYYEQEGQPISLLEAMLTGNIIITTKHAGIPDIVSEANGFFCEKKSGEHIAEILEDISQNLASYVSKYSKTNTAYIRNNFTEEVFSQKLISLFNEISTVK